MLSWLRALRSAFGLDVLQEEFEDLSDERFPFYNSPVKYSNPINDSLAQAVNKHALALHKTLSQAYQNSDAIQKCSVSVLATTVVVKLELADDFSLQWRFYRRDFEDLTIFNRCCKSFCSTLNTITICTQCFTHIEGGEHLKIEDTRNLVARIEKGLEVAGYDPLEAVLLAQEIELVFTLFEEIPHDATVEDLMMGLSL